MDKARLNAEELEQVTGGETYFEGDTVKGLKDAIAFNLPEGAQHFVIVLINAGKRDEVKRVLAEATVHNEAWERANLFLDAMKQ